MWHSRAVSVPLAGEGQLAAGRDINTGHGDPPSAPGRCNMEHQPYRLTLSLYEATLWSLSILDDRMCRWKPAFAPCLSLPAPARLKVP